MGGKRTFQQLSLRQCGGLDQRHWVQSFWPVQFRLAATQGHRPRNSMGSGELNIHVMEQPANTPDAAQRARLIFSNSIF